MLVIRRKLGQSIHIGGDTILRLVDRTRNPDRSKQLVIFSIEDSDGGNVATVTSPVTEFEDDNGNRSHKGRIPLTNGAEIAILPLGRMSQGVSFGIVVPDEIEMSVLRGELVGRPRKQNQNQQHQKTGA